MTPLFLDCYPLPSLAPSSLLAFGIETSQTPPFFLLYGQFPFSPLPLITYTQPGPNLYLYKSCKYVKFYPCALSLLSQPQTLPGTPPFSSYLAVVIIWGLYCTYLGCVCGGWGQPLCTELPSPLPHATLPTHHPKGRERHLPTGFILFSHFPSLPNPPPSLLYPYRRPFFSTPSPISFFSGVCGETEKPCLINGDCSFISLLAFLSWDLQEGQQGDKTCFLKGDPQPRRNYPRARQSPLGVSLSQPDFLL